MIEARAPLSVMTLAAGIVPVVPPVPICNVPPLIVVVPL